MRQHQDAAMERSAHMSAYTQPFDIALTREQWQQVASYRQAAFCALRRALPLCYRAQAVQLFPDIAFPALLRAVQIFDPAKGKLTTLVYRCVRTATWTWVRSPDRRHWSETEMRPSPVSGEPATLAESLLAPTSASTTDSTDECEFLQKCLSRLTVQEQQLLQCIYTRGMSCHAVSRMLKRTPQAIAVRHQKLLQKLRAMMRKEIDCRAR